MASADTRAQESVEIEQRRRAERVDVVFVVERVEHLQDRDHLEPAPLQVERPRDAPVEAEERIVLALRVAAAVDPVEAARARRDRLGAPSLEPRVRLEAPDDEIAEDVEL